MSLDTSLIYRTTGAWGPGLGTDLANYMVDSNFWALVQNDEYLLALVNGFVTTPPTSIEDFIVAGDQFYVQLTNSTLLGPYQLPSALWVVVPGGNWQPNTPYVVNNVFTHNGTVYLVIFPYPGAPTFDPGANDGHGHNYFSPILILPDNFLPSGGYPGMVLEVETGGGSGIPTSAWSYLLPIGSVGGNFLKLVTPGSPTTPPGLAWSAISGGDISNLYLENLVDVIITPPLTASQVLTWSIGGFWTNEFISGSHGHGSGIALEDLSDVFITSPIEIGQSITWVGDGWTNQASAGGVQSVQVSLSQADILALNTSGFFLVAAPFSGFTIMPLTFNFKYTFGTTVYYNPQNSLFIKWGVSGAENKVPSDPINSYSSNARTAFAGWQSTTDLGSYAGALTLSMIGSVGYNAGPILTSSLNNGGLGYAPGDTGTIQEGSSGLDATYQVLTVGALGVVVTYSITAGGTYYYVQTNQPTAVGGAQPGAGAGFTIDINSITPGDGTLTLSMSYIIAPDAP